MYDGNKSDTGMKAGIIKFIKMVRWIISLNGETFGFLRVLLL